MQKSRRQAQQGAPLKTSPRASIAAPHCPSGFFLAPRVNRKGKYLQAKMSQRRTPCVLPPRANRSIGANAIRWPPAETCVSPARKEEAHSLALRGYPFSPTPRKPQRYSYCPCTEGAVKPGTWGRGSRFFTAGAGASSRPRTFKIRWKISVFS